MVASHTWSHKDLSKLSYDQIHNEMWLVEQALERLLGVKPGFMRPPYGSYNNLVRQVAYERGQKLVLWDFDSGDSTGSTAAQSEKAYDNLIAKHPSTILPLNHEVYSTFLSFSTQKFLLNHHCIIDVFRDHCI
jgi:peptidoglycan/xylan/chitin deacetylase (PgdA/CDA1 family)